MEGFPLGRSKNSPSPALPLNRKDSLTYWRQDNFLLYQRRSLSQGRNIGRNPSMSRSRRNRRLLDRRQNCQTRFPLQGNEGEEDHALISSRHPQGTRHSLPTPAVALRSNFRSHHD